MVETYFGNIRDLGVLLYAESFPCGGVCEGRKIARLEHADPFVPGESLEPFGSREDFIRIHRGISEDLTGFEL